MPLRNVTDAKLIPWVEECYLWMYDLESTCTEELEEHVKRHSDAFLRSIDQHDDLVPRNKVPFVKAYWLEEGGGRAWMHAKVIWHIQKVDRKVCWK